MVVRNIGIPVRPPQRSCEDSNCPFHGALRIRGKMIEGTVVSKKMNRSVTVERDYMHYFRKYMRYEKRRSRIMAHCPPCLEINEGRRVTIAECRPISKEVAFVVVQSSRE